MEDETEEEGVEWFENRSDIKQCWRDKGGKFHRINGPAVIWEDGYTFWCRHGQLHRADGPAVEKVPDEEEEEWYKDGEKYEPSAHELMLWKMKKKEY